MRLLKLRLVITPKKYHITRAAYHYIELPKSYQITMGNHNIKHVNKKTLMHINNPLIKNSSVVTLYTWCLEEQEEAATNKLKQVAFNLIDHMKKTADALHKTISELT